jgi:hypothetical protein
VGSRRSIPNAASANIEGQVIENAPLNVLRNLDPNDRIGIGDWL